MFFFFSKLVYFFIVPEYWILALLLLRLFSKSPAAKRRLTIIIVSLVLFFGNQVIYSKLVLAWQPKPVQLPQNRTYEAGILLGGTSSFDKHNTGFLNASSDRVFETCVLYKTGKIRKIIITGGALYNDRPKEAPFLLQKITQLGIPANDVIIEQESRTTFENADYTKKIIDSLKMKPPFILVTSAFHVRRAESAFAKAGLPVIAFPTDYRVIEKKFNLFEYVVPQLYVINEWASFSKEMVGLAGYKLFKKA